MMIFIKIFHTVPLMAIVAILNHAPLSASKVIRPPVFLTGIFTRQLINSDDKDVILKSSLGNDILLSKNIIIVYFHNSKISTFNASEIIFLFKNLSSHQTPL
ncbi:hypothetical protein METHB2_160011 [Candidatus Methylobacter favarea]|uniref:Uncharacterized protein n=1 Tax=Candidatus Methylobacter favarea TaxID=2707345 RepID=A0A8S0XEP6_9GAMM|nr:hypothetical protein METHB2_160011 [Candidatus Methylobacter favarea]